MGGNTRLVTAIFESIETIKADGEFPRLRGPGQHALYFELRTHAYANGERCFVCRLVEQLVPRQCRTLSVVTEKNASTIPSATNARKTVVLDVSFVAIGQTSFARLPMMR